MDRYTADMIELGVTGMIGKGERGEQTREILKGKCVYFAVLGGVGAKQALTIRRQETIAFADSGMEALLKLEIVDFPAIVIHDMAGNDAYALNQELWHSQLSKT